MAGGEIYRVEIPIIVDDQSEAPLERARERVNRFQRSTEKTNERLRRMAAREYRFRLAIKDTVWPALQRIGRGLYNVTRKVWTVTIQAKDKVTNVAKRVWNAVTSPLALLGAGAGTAAAIVYPLQQAGLMEQAQIAMEYFTGSAQKGQKFLERLQAFAAKTPFEFPDVRQAAVGLMPLYKNMYGVDKAMDETIRTIRAFGDAAGFTGAGIEGMNLALLGFRQIGTMGKLQMEELRQVTENLLIPMDIVLKELGLNGDALDDLGKRGIKAKTAMEAIIRALEKHFKGGMEKMSKSLLGLESTVKDTARLTVTAFGAGMAGPVKRIFFDIVGVTDYTGEKYKAFQKKLEDAGRKVGEYFERVYKRAKQYWGKLSDDPKFKKLDFEGKINFVIEDIGRIFGKWFQEKGAPAAAKYGYMVGKELVKATANGAGAAVLESPILSFLLGAYVGAKVPGPLPVKILVGISIAMAPMVRDLLLWLKNKNDPNVIMSKQYKEQQQAFAWAENQRKKVGPNKPLVQGGSISAYKPSIGERILNFLKPHAYGGILTRPHLGLVAEAGPEAIIPLSARMRNKALALYEETGRWLGVRPYAEGGFAGPVPALAVGSVSQAVPAATINMHFDLAGLVGQVVVNNQGEIDSAIDRIAGAIADDLRGIYQNMVRKQKEN